MHDDLKLDEKLSKS